jgi:O-methyltransferase domain/Dimerisation domain
VAAEVEQAAKMRQMILAYQISQCLHVAAKLGIADILETGPKSIGELAARTGTEPAALGRLLRVLACHGVFAGDERAQYSLNSLAMLLSSKAPHSLRSAAIYWGEPWMWEAWGHLAHSVRTGAPAFDHLHGVSFFDFLERMPEAASTFDCFMSDGLHPRHRAVAEAYDFSQAGTILDIGGNQGAQLVEILTANPEARGILFDRPHVLEGARGRLRDAAVIDRCALAPGDFFDGVPEGADIYLLSQIVHDWNDERALRILRNCRRATGRQAKLLLIEQVFDPLAPLPATALLDLTMLAIVGGKERSADEYRTLLDLAGFSLSRIVATASPFSIIESLSA